MTEYTLFVDGKRIDSIESYCSNRALALIMDKHNITFLQSCRVEYIGGNDNVWSALYMLVRCYNREVTYQNLKYRDDSVLSHNVIVALQKKRR